VKTQFEHGIFPDTLISVQCLERHVLPPKTVLKSGVKIFRHAANAYESGNERGSARRIVERRRISW
jgi:hypothetical protein